MVSGKTRLSASKSAPARSSFRSGRRDAPAWRIAPPVPARSEGPRRRGLRFETDPARFTPQDETAAEPEFLALAERQERGHIIVRDVPEAPGDLPEEFPGHAPGQGRQKERQGLQVELDPVVADNPAVADDPVVADATAKDEFVGQLADEAVEELLVLPHDAGQPGQVGYDLRFVRADHLRQEPGPDAVAQEPAVTVGGVLAERQAPGVEPGPEVLAGDPQERPDHRAGGAGDNGRDPGQPRQPRPSHEAHEHGLGLIGHGMAGGDLGRPAVRGGPAEEAITQLAPGLLEVHLPPAGERPDVGRPGRERQDPAAGQVANEALVLPRLVPEPVVEVGQADLEGHLLAERLEQRDQGDGIGPPGESGQHPVSRHDQPAVATGLFKRGQDAVGGLAGGHGLVPIMGARTWKNGGGGI
jgi:hypothetical protein